MNPKGSQGLKCLFEVTHILFLLVAIILTYYFGVKESDKLIPYSERINFTYKNTLFKNSIFGFINSTLGFKNSIFDFKNSNSEKNISMNECEITTSVTTPVV